MKLSYSKFANCLGVQTAVITMNVKRGNLEADEENKTIDFELTKNKIWIEQQIAKGKTWDLNSMHSKTEGKQSKKTTQKPTKSKKTPGKHQKITNVVYEDPNLQRLRELEFQKKKEELKKTQNTNRLEEIKIQKLSGELVPVDAVKSVFIFAIEEFRTGYLQELNALASVYVERLGGEERHYKELQRDITERVNQTLSGVKESMKKGLSTIIEEYQEVRGRGERK